MAGPDRRRTLLEAYENAATIVSGTKAEELGDPTPCPKYDVAGLVDHIVEAVPAPPGADDWERLAAFMGRDPRAPFGR